MGCLRALLERRHARDGLPARGARRVQRALRRAPRAHGVVAPGHEQLVQERKGRVITTSPWRLVDYWRWTKEPDLSDFELR